MQAIHVQSTDDVSCRTSRADVFAEQREAGDVTVAHSSVQLTHQTAHRTAGVLGRSSDPERRGAWPTGANPRSLVHKEKPHILRRGAFSTGGGALRWASGSTPVRLDGPPSFRAVHSPLLTGGPATGDSTDSPERSQHSRVGATGRTRLTRGTELDGVPM